MLENHCLSLSFTTSLILSLSFCHTQIDLFSSFPLRIYHNKYRYQVIYKNLQTVQYGLNTYNSLGLSLDFNNDVKNLNNDKQSINQNLNSRTWICWFLNRWRCYDQDSIWEECCNLVIQNNLCMSLISKLHLKSSNINSTLKLTFH